MNNFLSPEINFQSLSASSLTSIIANADTDKDFKINWSTSSLSGFVFFGSASSITNLAISKILTTYPINKPSTALTASSTDFENAQKYYYSYSQFEQQILNGFSYSLTGNYNNDSFKIINIPRNIDNSVSEINDQIYINSILSDAITYDDQNINTLQDFIPTKFMEYDNDNILSNLLSVWAQVFDETLLYINNFSVNLFDTRYNNNNRTEDIVNTFNLLGLNIYTNYLFSSLLDFLIVTDNKISYKAIRAEIWNRIFINLIYIYKTKGTIASIKAFLNCLGLNADLIDIHEYVNFKTPQYVNVTRQRNVFELNFNSQTASYISATSNNFNLNMNEWSIVCNLNFKGINKTQNIMAVTNQYSVAVIDDSYLDDYKQLIIAGHISFTGYLNNSSVIVLSSLTGNIFSNNPQTLIIQKTTSSYEIYLNSISAGYYGVGGNIPLSAGNLFYLGSNGINLNNTYSGSIINLRIFNTSLSPQQISNFSYNMNNINLLKENLNNNVLVNWELNEPLYFAYINNNYQYSIDTGNNSERIILDSSTGFINGTATGYSHFPVGNYYNINTYSYIDKRFVSGLTQYSDKINIGSSTYENTKYLDMEIKPISVLNDAFEYVMGAIDVIDYLSRNDFNSNYNKYIGLESLQNIFYSTSVNIDGILTLIDEIDKYGVGLFEILSQFLPTNSIILYKGIVIESPIYDRNKHIVRNLELTNLSQLEDKIETHSLLSTSISEFESNIDIEYEEASIINSLSSKNVNIYSITGNLNTVFDVPIDITLVSPFGDEIYDTLNSTSAVDININYLYNSDNIVSSYLLDNQLITPINSRISSKYGKLVTNGYNNIYLNYSFSGSSLYNIGYLDLLGDNIIGTKYTIYQNIGGNSPAFNIINLDNGITSNSLMQTFYIDNYNGNNIIFSFIPSVGSLTSIKNKIIINDSQEQEIDFNIIWNPDSRTIYNNYIISDTSILYEYPVTYWNLNTGISAVTAVYSDYGASITSSTLTTTADVYFNTSLSLTSINIVFKNYSSDVDDELNMIYFTSLTSPTMNLYQLIDSSNNILYKSSLDNYSLLKTKIYKNSTVAFTLLMNYANNKILTYGNELIVNGGFETYDTSGWTVSGSLTAGGPTQLVVTTNPTLAQSGYSFLACSTTAVLYQVVAIQPNTNYTLSLWNAMGLYYWSGTNEYALLVITETISNVNTLSAADTSPYIVYSLPRNSYSYQNTNLNITTSSTANYLTIAIYFYGYPNYIRLDNVSLKPYNYLPAASGYIKFNTSTNKSFKINFSNNGI